MIRMTVALAAGALLLGGCIATHVCYTLAEKRALEERNQREYNRRFGPQQCLDRSSVACQGGLERPAGG